MRGVELCFAWLERGGKCVANGAEYGEVVLWVCCDGWVVAERSEELEEFGACSVPVVRFHDNAPMILLDMIESKNGTEHTIVHYSLFAGLVCPAVCALQCSEIENWNP